MMTSQEHDHFGRHTKLWTVTAINWRLENPDLHARPLIPSDTKDPAAEIEMTRELESVEAPDLDQAIAAAHRLLDKHTDHVGEYALEIYVTAHSCRTRTRSGWESGTTG